MSISEINETIWQTATSASNAHFVEDRASLSLRFSSDNGKVTAVLEVHWLLMPGNTCLLHLCMRPTYLSGVGVAPSFSRKLLLTEENCTLDAIRETLVHTLIELQLDVYSNYPILVDAALTSIDDIKALAAIAIHAVVLKELNSLLTDGLRQLGTDPIVPQVHPENSVLMRGLSSARAEKKAQDTEIN